MKLITRASSMFDKKWGTFFVLLLLFFIALGLRSYKLGEMPSGFHRDEVISGYAGRFILQNGKDFYGNPWPLLYVDKYHDYPPALPMYLSGIGTYIFGVTVFATRFPIAVVGALIVFPMYFLSLEVLKDRRMAMIATIVIILLPWHFVLSRATAEGIVALTVAVTGLYTLIKFINTTKQLYLYVTIPIFLLTYLLYPSYRVLIPLILIPVPFLFPFNRKGKSLMVLTIALFVAVIGIMLMSPWGRERFSQTNIFSQGNMEHVQIQNSILASEEGSDQTGLVKLYHNKVVLLTRQFIGNYISYFSPEFLVYPGGQPYRYVISDSGVIYIIMIPLLFASLYFIRDMKWRIRVYLLYLLIIAPMPAPVTTGEIPNVHRTLFMSIPVVLFSVYGFVKIIDRLHRRSLKLGFVVIVLGIFVGEFIYFQHMYFHHANAVKSSERGDTNKEVMQTLIAEKKKYKQVYVSVDDAFPIYYLFFTKNFNASIIGKIHTNLLSDPVDNVTFVQNHCVLQKLKEQGHVALNSHDLIVELTSCPVDKQTKQLYIFSRHDGTTSYRFVVPTSTIAH